jgi:hypothetical protein
LALSPTFLGSPSSGGMSVSFGGPGNTASLFTLAAASARSFAIDLLLRKCR